MLYEKLVYRDEAHPVICHHDVICPEQHFSAHWHENYELISVTAGTAELLLDGHRFQAQTGDVAVIGSGVMHFIAALTPRLEYECLLVDRDSLVKRGMRPANPMLREVVRDARISALIHDVLMETKAEKPMYRPAVMAMIDLIFVLLIREHLLSEGRAAQERGASHAVRTAMRYIHAHYAQPITLQDICRNVGFTKNYFCRVFSEYAGQAPIHYLNHVRCEDARRLLRSGACNVSEAAQRCGFRNMSYFSHYYKQIIGHSPSCDLPQHGEYTP